MNRRIALLAALAASGPAVATDFGTLVGSGYRGMVERGVLRPRQSPPTAAPGFAHDQPDRELPQPQEGREREGFQLLNADAARQNGNDVQAEGNVRFAYRGYDVRAERVVGNLATEEFLLEGKVQVVGADQKVEGDQVVVRFAEESFRFLRGSAVLGPGFVGGGVRSDIYIKGAQGAGSEVEFDVYGATVTPCEGEVPQFEFVADRANVRPGDRALLREVTIKVMGRSVATLPYLLIPLAERRQRITPEVGQSRDEGYYIKTRFGNPIDDYSYWDQRVDYYTKLGAGLGGDYNYNYPDATGVVRLFGVTGGPGSRFADVRHRQNLGNSTFAFDGNYAQDNYLSAPNSTLGTARASLTIPQASGSSRLSYSLQSSDTRGFDSKTEVIGLGDTRRWGGGFETSLNANYTSGRTRGSGTDANRRELLDLRLGASQRLNSGTARLDYQRTIPVGEIDNFFSPSDRTPVLSFETDARRLLGEGASRSFPWSSTFSIGELLDPGRKRPITRTHLDWRLNPVGSFRSPGWYVSGRFTQGLYSDDTAQYTLNSDLGYRVEFDRRSSAGIRYRYLRPYGFTPLNVDRSGRTNLVSADISARPLRSLLLSAEASYDIQQLELRERGRTPWQTLTFRQEWRPNDVFQLRGASNYDPFRQVWSNLRFDMGWAVSGGFVSLGSRYDGTRHTWSNVNLLAEGLVWGKLSTSVLLSFNGFTDRFDSRQLSFTYDLGCTEAILQIIDTQVGFRPGTEFAFFLRVKALPFETPFGLGRRGQAIGTGTGIEF